MHAPGLAIAAGGWRTQRAGGPNNSEVEMNSRAGRSRAWRTVAVMVAGWVLASASLVHAQCTIDVQENDDQVKQSDLTQFCLSGTCGGSNVTIGWSWDNTDWPGNNTGDA